MRSKHVKVVSMFIGAGLISLMTVSCSYFFDDKEEKKNSYDLSLNEKTGVNCVKDNGDLLRDYFEMKRDDAQIARELVEMKKCLRDAVDLFVRHTQSSSENKDSYTPADIHDFLSSAFDSYTFVATFMDDAVRLKDSLIGGTPFRITKAEVRLLSQYIDFVYDGLAILAPERRLLFNTDRSTEWEKFPAASEKLLKIVAQFQSLPRKTDGQFDFVNFFQVAKYFIDDENMEQWDKSFKLINSLQALLTAGKPDIINSKQLPFALNKLVSLYLTYVEFSKFLQDDVFFDDMASILTFPALVRNAVDNPEALDGNKPVILNSIHLRILAAFEDATNAAPEGRLSMDYLDHFVDTLKLNASLPDYIKAETLKALFPEFFSLWLSQKLCEGDKCRERWVKTEHIVTFRNLLNEWKERQMWINAQSKTNVVVERGALSPVPRNSNSPVIKSFINSLDTVNHLHWEKYLVVGKKQLNYKNLVIFHDIYTLAQLFARPFNGNANKPQISDYYLNREQALIFYTWFHPLGLEMELVDPRSSVTSTAAMTEINLFGSTASKPLELNLGELIEYFEISISTSFRAVDLITNAFQDGFGKTCRVPGVYDVFGYQKVYAECFRNEWLANHEQFLFNSMPKLEAYLNTVSDDEYLTTMNLLERSARQGLIVDEHFDTDALRQMSSIMQYAESLFNRFDGNNSNVIESDELKAALAHLIPNISGILETSVDPAFAAQLYKFFPNFEEDLITYILAKKELPELLTSETLGGAATSAIKVFKIWSNSKGEWLNQNPNIKRTDVLLVISGLSSLARVTKVKNMKKHFFDWELEFQKPLVGPQDPVLKPLAKELMCAQHVEQDLLQWLYDNKVHYWDEALNFVQPGQFVFFGWDPSSLNFGMNDIPGINDINFTTPGENGTQINLANAVEGWEKDVTYKLIELLSKEPVLGAWCSVPFVAYNGNKIAPLQDYKKETCVSFLGVINCHTRTRTPY